jgi:signal recognition particle receptor subunit beta
MAEHVILFGGPMGAGKTTAIQTLSEVDVIRTEAANTDRAQSDKPTTTVALDYGEITIGEDEKIRLYGIPGQRRFDFMWSILKERARGMVLLVGNDVRDPVGAMLDFIEDFRDLYARGGIVVGISRTDVQATPTYEEYAAALAAVHPDLVIPIFTVDPRNVGHMQTVLMTLIANIEMRAAFDRSDELETAL